LAEGAVHNDQKTLFSRQGCILPLDMHLTTINFVLSWTLAFDAAHLLNLRIVL
jgi:exonuclease I